MFPRLNISSYLFNNITFLRIPVSFASLFPTLFDHTAGHILNWGGEGIKYPPASPHTDSNTDPPHYTTDNIPLILPGPFIININKVSN